MIRLLIVPPKERHGTRGHLGLGTPLIWGGEGGSSSTQRHLASALRGVDW